MADVGRHVVFSGRVQGVGFRMTAVEVARRFEVTGFVRNLADGRVEMMTEGEPEILTAFVTAVERAMGGLVRETCSTERSAEGRYDTFTVLH